jgi:hypothetical protein
MAGERYSKLTIRAAWSQLDYLRADQTQEVRFRLAGQWVTYRRGAYPDRNEFVVPDPDDVGRDYVLRGVKGLLDLVQKTITDRGLSYTVSAPRDGGDSLDHVNAEAGVFDTRTRSVVEFDIEASVYDANYDLNFSSVYQTGWKIVNVLSTIRPIYVEVTVVNATIFGSATGRISLEARNGSTGNYTYQWDDPKVGNTATRENVKAGTYTCVVSDASGASTRVIATVGSDPLFTVAINTTDTSIELVPAGGLPPYTFKWDDGPTTATRQNLKAGTYKCLVTEGRGLTKYLTITLSAYQYHWSRNPITLALDAGQAYRDDPTIKPNLSFLCEVWLELDYLSGVFTQVGTTLEQPASSDGRTIFDVQTLLAAYLDHHVPAVGEATVLRATSLFKRFYLKHAEQFGEVPERAQATSLERRYVVQGGLSFYQARTRTWFTDYQPTKLPFLTWEPRVKSVLADQPEYLYYMVQNSPDAFQVRVRVGFSDKTQQDLTLPGATGVRDFEVYCLPAGYRALGLATVTTTPERRVSWWEVTVVNPAGGPALSETRRYELERKGYPHRRYLLFATSLGGMATYAALGETQEDAEVKGEESVLTLASDYDVLAGDVLVQERSLRPVLKLASGPREKAQLEASRDLLLSRRVLLQIGTRWAPGYLKPKTVNVLDESKLVPTQELEFYLTTERNYTPEL